MPLSYRTIYPKKSSIYRCIDVMAMDEHVRNDQLSYIPISLDVIYIKELDVVMFFIELIVQYNYVKLVTDTVDEWFIIYGHSLIGSNIKDAVRDIIGEGSSWITAHKCIE